MPRCKENPSESPGTSTRTQNTNFDDAKNKKSDGENELGDENEMIVDGKLLKHTIMYQRNLISQTSKGNEIGLRN